MKTTHYSQYIYVQINYIRRVWVYKILNTFRFLTLQYILKPSLLVTRFFPILVSSYIFDIFEKVQVWFG